MSARRIAIAGSPAHQVIDGGVLHLIEITSAGGAWTLAGISGGQDGQLLVIVNRGAYTMTVAHEDATVNARFRIQTSNQAAQVVPANQTCLLGYDYLTGRWVLVAIGGVDAEVVQTSDAPLGDVVIRANDAAFADEEFVIADGKELVLEDGASLVIS